MDDKDKDRSGLHAYLDEMNCIAKKMREELNDFDKDTPFKPDISADMDKLRQELIFKNAEIVELKEQLKNLVDKVEILKTNKAHQKEEWEYDRRVLADACDQLNRIRDIVDE